MIRVSRASLIPAVMFVSLLVVFGCTAAPEQRSSGPVLQPTGQVGDAPVAFIGDEPITMSQVEDVAAGEMARLDRERYAAVKITLDRMLDERLLYDAASAEGKTVEEFLIAEIDDKIIQPSDAQIEAHYEKRKNEMARGRPLSAVRHHVINDINTKATNRLREELLERLGKEAGLRVLLEEPRTNVPIPEGEPSIGPKNAKVTVVEFSDFQCPYCQKSHPGVQQLIDEYKDRVRFVYRDYPIETHARARQSALAARCVGEQDRFWEYANNLMTSSGTLLDDDLLSRVQKVGGDVKKFRDCYESRRFDEAIDKSFHDAKRLGLRGTPTFFVNGRSFYGAQTYDSLKALVEEELN